MDKAIQETAAARHETVRKRLGDRVRLLRFQRRWTPGGVGGSYWTASELYWPHRARRGQYGFKKCVPTRGGLCYDGK